VAGSIRKPLGKNKNIRANVGPANLDITYERIGDAEAVKNLPLGNFVARNRLSSGKLDGRVF